MFWSEQYEKPEESIWEELKRMMLNPPSETDKKNKKLQEQAWIDTVLDKAFPQENKTPLLKSGVSYEKSLDPYAEIDSKKDWSEEKKSQKKAEVARIREAAVSREKEINREHLLNQVKNYGGAALEIGSLAVPGMLQRRLATQTIKMSKPLAEQVIKKTLQRGAVEGSLSGTLEGLGRGIREDENILKTTTEGAVIGGITGTALGKIAGEVISKTPKIKNLDELLDKRRDWGIAHTKQSGNPAGAIEKLMERKKGFVPKAVTKEGIGDIDFVWGDKGKGLQHIIERRNLEGKNGINYVKKLPQIIIDAPVYNKFKHYDRKYIGNEKQEVAIKKNWNNKPRNWIVSAYDLSEPSSQALPGGRALEQTYASGQRISPLDLKRQPNDIILSSTSNLNPSQSAKVYETSTTQTPKSNDEWLKWLKRKRKGML